MPTESGHERFLDEFRAALNPDTRSDDVELLYGYDKEGGRRWANLASYIEFMLSEQPDVMMIGEAPGYRGTSITGVPFLSEEVILTRKAQGKIVPVSEYHPSDSSNGPTYEATSTFMWNTLDSVHFPKIPFLWAVFPNHPHESMHLETNRKPRINEIKTYERATEMLMEKLPIQHIIAIGNVAYAALSHENSRAVTKVRHPARGGSKQFKDGIATFINETYGRD
jgi:uracil-DNA glycosylase